MEHSLQELMRNARAEENTFIYMLHEEARFDQSLFWRYVNSIMELTRLTADQPLSREAAGPSVSPIPKSWSTCSGITRTPMSTKLNISLTFMLITS